MATHAIFVLLLQYELEKKEYAKKEWVVAV